MRRMLALLLVIGLQLGCGERQPTPRPARLKPCPDRHEGLRVIIAQQVTNPTGRNLLLPCTIENRLSERVERIRYFVGFFDGTTAPTLDQIRRVEHQADIELAPGQTKTITLEAGGPQYLGGNSPICFGVRAVPFALGGKEIPAAEAWAHEAAP